MIGEHQVLFDADPFYTIEAHSYVTVGQIDKQNMDKIFSNHPDLRSKMIDEHIQNPHD